MIQKLFLATFWVSFSFAVSLAPATVFAENVPVAGQSVSVKFACVDGSGDANIAQATDASGHKYLRVSCKSGALFDYQHYGESDRNENETSIITATLTCPAPLSAVSQPDHPGQLSGQYLVYCKKFTTRDASGQPQYTFTTTYPASKSVQTTENTDVAGSGDPGPSSNQSRIDASSLPQVAASQTTIRTILNILFGILGGIAVLVVVIGGMRYVFANGEANQIAQAKNTIVYALIGLIIAMAGYSIVTFVIKNI